ncbi:hypothetical protein HOG21_00090 [bacterium]|jgi:hypothetical protein|nr:hypothetical protein [bacterium]
MTQVLLKNIPSTFKNIEINFKEKLKEHDKENLMDAIEFLEDYLYISNREKNSNTINYVAESEVDYLLEKYNK